MSLKRPFVPKSDVKQRFTTTTPPPPSRPYRQAADAPELEQEPELRGSALVSLSAIDT